MDRNKLIRLFHTLKYLKFIQIYYRVYYLVKNKLVRRPKLRFPKKDIINTIVWSSPLIENTEYLGSNTFTFLNIEQKFGIKIDWNYNNIGKLWTYNLNYFAFLNQQTISKEDGVALINDYIKNHATLKDGLEPYPISLRGINWIKFLSKHDIKNKEIDSLLYHHYHILLKNLEYHLMGNHLIENGFSLLFAAYYFKEEAFYQSAYKILKNELSEQILQDGGHFELSPMYHQILLNRLLDTINLVQNNKWKYDSLIGTLIPFAQKMLSWLSQVTFKDGNIPMFNDATYKIAPLSRKLFQYAHALKIDWTSIPLDDSGYRNFYNDLYECIVDVGKIGPDYIPGHAHADTFNFVLNVADKPLIVDTGISTYEKNERRQLERGTISHNTVIVGNRNQSDVWGGFRVAKRAKITLLKDDKNNIKATHDGYKDLGIYHKREFSFGKNDVTIIDHINGNKNHLPQVANFHFHPNVQAIQVNDKKIQIGKCIITFKNAHNIQLSTYSFALGYNHLTTSQKVNVHFSQEFLETKITID